MCRRGVYDLLGFKNKGFISDLSSVVLHNATFEIQLFWTGQKTLFLIFFDFHKLNIAIKSTLWRLAKRTNLNVLFREFSNNFNSKSTFRDSQSFKNAFNIYQRCDRLIFASGSFLVHSCMEVAQSVDDSVGEASSALIYDTPRSSAKLGQNLQNAVELDKQE